MANPKTKGKDPDALLNYTWDWEPWLDGETIDSYEFIVPDDLTVENQSSTDTTVTIWLSGGEGGTNYAVVCRIFTASSPPLINDWTMTLKIKDQ